VFKVEVINWGKSTYPAAEYTSPRMVTSENMHSTSSQKFKL